MTRPRLPLLLPLLLLLLLAPACGRSDPTGMRIWTMIDLQHEMEQGEQGLPFSNPGGLPADYFVGRSATTDGEILQIKLSFSQGAPAAYMTTDFWANYDQIWLEPMYVLVTAWNAADPLANRLPGAWPILSVGPDSGFYSPYWKVFYVEVPAETPPDHYRSQRQLFEDGRVMHAGPNRFCSVQPPGLSAPSADDIRPLLADYVTVGASTNLDAVLAQVAGSARQVAGYLDGQEVSYLDFGIDGFSADGDAVVEDIPLYTFRQRGADGALGLVGNSANVGGVAPPHSGGGAQVGGDNRPHFGGLWRLYTVEIPPDAGELGQEIWTARALGDAWRPYVHRVALAAESCFVAGGAPASCTWLDSQAQIEKWISFESIARTPLEPACPFMMWRGLPVPNPPPPDQAP